MDGQVFVDIANTQSKVAIRMEDDPVGKMGAMRLTRYSRPCRKSMTTQLEWFAKVVTGIEQLVQRIGNQENVSFRQAFYSNTISNPGMSPAAFKDLVNDIAVTCRMHPTSLGVDPDETGEVYLGKDINLKVFRAENVFTVDPEKPKFRKVASPSPIPSRVLRIKVEGDLRAVIVVEHKNLATQMSLIERGLTDVMIIKVQFYF
ncbi:MAG: hypothetical protein L6R42_002180 [Xanthoria sp. 1 TBL-2021]|nr:MAG: hypothetical protein L6R42_002180 [Xanthoria sp. 1 TBL-2021]